jgi:hypothetical protein
MDESASTLDTCESSGAIDQRDNSQMDNMVGTDFFREIQVI